MGITTPETPSDAEKPQAQALSLDPAENIHNSLKGYENCWPTTGYSAGLETYPHL